MDKIRLDGYIFYQVGLLCTGIIEGSILFAYLADSTINPTITVIVGLIIAVTAVTLVILAEQVSHIPNEKNRFNANPNLVFYDFLFSFLSTTSFVFFVLMSFQYTYLAIAVFMTPIILALAFAHYREFVKKYYSLSRDRHHILTLVPKWAKHLKGYIQVWSDYHIHTLKTRESVTIDTTGSLACLIKLSFAENFTPSQIKGSFYDLKGNLIHIQEDKPLNVTQLVCYKNSHIVLKNTDITLRTVQIEYLYKPTKNIL